MEPPITSREATLSACGRYRYWLGRWWQGPRPEAMIFLMLNPSTADGSADDPTVARCVGFARREGYGGVGIVNLYALRAPHPAALRTADDPVGPENDRWIEDVCRSAVVLDLPIVCAWGAGVRPARVDAVVAIARRTGARLWCLGVTRDGQPRHPLYLPADAALRPWPSEDGCGNG